MSLRASIAVGIVGWVLALALLGGWIEARRKSRGSGAGIDYEQAVDKMMSDLVVGIPPNVRVAVLPFTNAQGTPTAIGRYSSDSVVAWLTAKKGISVFDRENIATLIEEADRMWSGRFNTQTAPKLSELLGISFILSGTVVVTRSEVVVTARATDVETGSIVGAVTTSGNLTRRLEAVAHLDTEAGSPCLDAASDFVGAHFQWLWAAIVVPVSLWLVHLLRSRSGPSAKEGRMSRNASEANER
jgi:TolB-like protein